MADLRRAAYRGLVDIHAEAGRRGGDGGSLDEVERSRVEQVVGEIPLPVVVDTTTLPLDEEVGW